MNLPVNTCTVIGCWKDMVADECFAQRESAIFVHFLFVLILMIINLLKFPLQHTRSKAYCLFTVFISPPNCITKSNYGIPNLLSHSL